MNAVSIALLCVSAALVCAVLKRRWPELALGISIAAGVAALAALAPTVLELLNAAGGIAEAAGIPDSNLRLMLEGCGISLIAEFAAQICRDAGETALAGRVLTGTRITLLAMAVPVVTDIFASLTSLLAGV